jgi:hypothetical protein
VKKEIICTISLNLADSGRELMILLLNRRLNMLYNNIRGEINPSQPTTKVTHVGAFDVDFSMVLRERIASNMLIM